MSRVILLTAFALLCVHAVLSAPAEEETKTDVVASPDPKPAEDRQAVVSNNSFLDTLMSGGNAWTLATTALSALLILGGLGLAFYYFYYLNNYAYGAQPQTFSGYDPASFNYYGNGRALPGGSFSFARVLDMIAMAQETYEKFDFQSMDCQKKALCELQQKQNEFGETGRKITSTFSFMDALDGLPMPTIIQAYLREYKDAIMQGKNSSKDCLALYPKCDFSIKEVFVKYSKKAKKQ